MTRTAALALACKGIRVFPCKNIPGDPEQHKAPLTIRGFRDASTDETVIATWWERWPDALVGVVADRFCVIDVDLQHPEARAWLDQHRARIPCTRTHRTQRGGLHFIFRPHAQVGCSVGILASHVDTRGQSKGYIIWWPACGLEVLHREVFAPVPDWVTEALLRPEPAPHNVVRFPAQSAHRKFEGIVKTIAGAREGERNSICYWGAHRMRELVAQNAIGRDAAIEIVIEAASRTGLSRNEARRTALSAFRR
jgi:hypothetical protein